LTDTHFILYHQRERFPKNASVFQEKDKVFPKWAAPGKGAIAKKPLTAVLFVAHCPPVGLVLEMGKLAMKGAMRPIISETEQDAKRYGRAVVSG
jgi:hypothetical protein